MSRLNLTNLQTVCCIARLGTFGAASDRLHTSQPAITARVRELEKSLGITFFQRRGRRMELTVEGRHFIARVEPLVAQIEETVLLHSDPSAAQGVVRIGAGAVTMTWLPTLLGDLKREIPGMLYELDVDMGMNMIEKLESGKLDMAIVAGKVRLPGMVHYDLKPSQLEWVVSSRAIRTAHGAPMSTAEILDRNPVWLVSRPSIVFPRAVAAARRIGANLHNVNTCGSMVGLLDLIDCGAGAGVVATELARQRMEAGALISLASQLETITLELTLLFAKDQQQSTIVKIAEHIVAADNQREARKPQRVKRVASRPTK